MRVDNKSNVKVGTSSIAKSGDLSANLKRVCVSEWKAEINNSLGTM